MRFVRTALGMVLATLLAGVIITVAPEPAAAMVDIVVDSTGNQSDQNPADGVCRTSSNTCTLRAAIQQANYNNGADRIVFNISGGGVKTINVGSSDLEINDVRGGVTIDGYTQPGASVNTAQTGSNAVIRIQVTGTSIVFDIRSTANTIRGLAVYGGSTNINIQGEGADGNQIVGNFIGTNAAGTFADSSGNGVAFSLGPDRNSVGRPSLEDRNIISGNGTRGLFFNHGETSQNLVQNNVIGLNPSGTAALRQRVGIDFQWWTWGNLVGGFGPLEGNVLSGQTDKGGVDFSHTPVNNLVVGNYIGTRLDGNSTASHTGNRHGILIKDNPTGNYLAENVIGGNDDNGIYNQHNYTGQNVVVDNRIGVGVNGGAIPNGGEALYITGHDDIYHGNIIANHSAGAMDITNFSSSSDRGTGLPDQRTERSDVRLGTFYNNGSLITIGSGAHPNEDTPQVTGLGPGEIYGDATTCGGCNVEVYVSGTVNADGTITPGNGTAGLVSIGSVTADAAGTFKMASPLIVTGGRINAISTTASGESSDFGTTLTVPAVGYGLLGNPDTPNSPPATPSPPPLPQPWPLGFECSESGGTLSWTDVNAANYYVFATTGGVESYLGGHSATSLTVAPADSYRVEHFNGGNQTEATCDGPGGGGGSFECSVSGATLSWTDAGADQYYVFATTGGTESYLGGHSTTSLTVAAADSYRVEHWLNGQTNATCDGPGGGGGFSCSVSNGTLSWTDAGATEYYVFATTGGTESYLGGHSTTSLSVAAADSYRVEHWLNGQTNATCDGPGGGGGSFECSVSGATLSWTDAGADQYYVFATTGGTESYLGGHSTTSLTVAAADSYRVEHWLDGQTNATCDGPGGGGGFSCSVSNGTLSWTDAGATEYYVFATTGGTESYLGGHSTTSLAVNPADSYRVEHWINGQTNAIC